MISIDYNETLKAIEIHLDIKGADLPIQKLERLKSEEGHFIYTPRMTIAACLRNRLIKKKRCTANSF